MNVTGLAAAASLCSLAHVAMAASAPPPGATSCSGCHVRILNLETGVPPIAGRNPNEIVAAMRAFRSGERPATVMDRIAKGFTDEEIQAIAEWLATQK